MKYTLLELTQAVLSSMDSDEINSITDSVESQQVVEVIKTVYDDIISRGDLMSNNTLFNLVASTDQTKPIMMFKPDNIQKITSLQYNCQKDVDPEPVWNHMRYLNVEDFFHFIYQYDRGSSDVSTFNHVIGTNNIVFAYRTDQAPTYWTTFDDNTIFFDSYDTAVDSTLQSSKTLCFGSLATDFQKVDTFVPNLQPQQFALLLNEAKSLAWAELKQTTHQKAEQSARRNWVHLQKTRQETPESNNPNNQASFFAKLPNFGRQR